jgi:hypothetical protein
MSAVVVDRHPKGRTNAPLIDRPGPYLPTSARQRPTNGNNAMETNKRRMLRRLRAEFRQELSVASPTRAERVLVELAALTALRARGMRDQIIAGQEPNDEDFVRIVRATTSIIKAFKEHRTAKQRDAKPKSFEDRMKVREQMPRKEFDENDF